MALAIFCWCAGVRSSASSWELLMKAVSTRIEGMSGAFRTANPARSMWFLWRSLILPISCRTWVPTLMESGSAARGQVEQHFGDLPVVRAQIDAADQVRVVFPLASQRAAELLAPCCESAQTEEPRAVRLMKASAWMDTNRSALTRRAFWTRTCSGTK
ncbi:hypothetical protein CDEF62S_03259 [Castellaniella defragrans]